MKWIYKCSNHSLSFDVGKLPNGDTFFPEWSDMIIIFFNISNLIWSDKFQNALWEFDMIW